MCCSRSIWLLITFLLFAPISNAQFSIPWSSTVNVTFGKGSVNPAPPLSAGYTSYTYTPEPCPAVGNYTILNKQLCTSLKSFVDAGHIYAGALPLANEDSGYVMLVHHQAAATPKIVFTDTVTNLCSSAYLFWAGIMNVSSNVCVYPNFTLRAETFSGEILGSFQTGDIGGPGDKWAWYHGFFDPGKKPPFPFYGGVFNLLPGTTDIIVKIIANASPANYCDYSFIIDNILLTPVGPEIKIHPPGNPDAWVTASCVDGSKRVELTGNIGNQYHNFGSTGYTPAAFTNTGYQWQQSTDNGYTWNDIPGANNINLSQSFYLADTFFVRLRVSEAVGISNPNCSVLSNIVRVEVGELPVGFNLASNSPVCTDGDVIFKLEGGASYTVTGPNGFFDNSSFAHIYNPTYKDTGWYYASLFTFGGCEAKDSTYVELIGPDLKISADQSICYGERVQLSATGGNTYTWTPADGLSATNVKMPYASPLGTTKYQVEVTDESRCSAQADVTVHVKNGPFKTRINGPAVVCPDDLAIFKDSSIGNIVTWRWSFGNGATSDVQNPPPQTYFHFANPATVPVRLTVTDSVGCSSTSQIPLKVVGNCNVQVPAAFTPNNDAKNDYLYPLNAYTLVNLSFRIYNRLGQLVFETKDWTRKWDGTLKGELQPPGTYVWTLEYTDGVTRALVHKKGTTLLLR